MWPPQWIGYIKEFVGLTYLRLLLQMAKRPETVAELDIMKVKSIVQHLKECMG